MNDLKKAQLPFKEALKFNDKQTSAQLFSGADVEAPIRLVCCKCDGDGPLLSTPATKSRQGGVLHTYFLSTLCQSCKR